MARHMHTKMTYSIYIADGPHSGSAFIHNMHKYHVVIYTKRVIISIEDWHHVFVAQISCQTVMSDIKSKQKHHFGLHWFDNLFKASVTSHAAVCNL